MDTTATQLTTVTDTIQICTVVDPLTEAPVAVAAEAVEVVIPIDRPVMVLVVSTAAETTSNFRLKTTTSRT